MNKAFTLIELLVVVLIIGILSAIALPQYTKAVEKSRSSQALVLLRTAYQNASIYYMENGTYPNSFEDMGFDIGWSGNSKWVSNGNEKDVRSNGDWSLQLYHAGNGRLILYAGRINGAYAGAGFEVTVNDTDKTPKPIQIRCAERVSNGVVFAKNDGDYCVKIMHGTLVNDPYVDTYRVYSLP